MSLTSILLPVLAAQARRAVTLDDATPEDDFDPAAEWDAMPALDDDAVALDGDFKGHPFRGNQYRRQNRRSSTAVRYSMRAKFHEGRNADDEDMQHRHGIARHAHEMAARSSTESTSARRYHLRMARFHKERMDHHGRRAGAQRRAADARARG